MARQSFVTTEPGAGVSAAPGAPLLDAKMARCPYQTSQASDLPLLGGYLKSPDASSSFLGPEQRRL
jgi:hypothetical protein